MYSTGLLQFCQHQSILDCVKVNKGIVINIQVRHQLHVEGQLFDFPSKESADEAWEAYQQTPDDFVGVTQLMVSYGGIVAREPCD